MSIPIPGSLISEFDGVVRDLFVSQYAQVSTLVLLAYYIVTTLADEVELFWNKRLSLSQVLFFMIRYPPMLFQIVLTLCLFDKQKTQQLYVTCEIWAHGMVSASGICTIYTMHAILILRLYGLYGSMRVVYALSCLMLLTFGAEVYIAAMLVPHFTAIRTVPAVGTVCSPGPGHTFALIWVPVLVFDTCAFGAALYKGVQQFRNGAVKSSRLMQTLLRDSFAYFLAIDAMVLTNLLVWLYVRISINSVTIGFTLAAMSILGSQMMMNIRLEAARRALLGAHCGENIVPVLPRSHDTAVENIPLRVVKHVETQSWTS